jgi:hypothetical protein
LEESFYSAGVQRRWSGGVLTPVSTQEASGTKELHQRR